MAWVYLLAAGLLEVAWVIGLKTYSFRFSLGTAATLVALIVSFFLLNLSLRTLPIGTAYGIWTGIGAVGAAVYGIVWLHEPRDWPRVLCIGLVVAGIVGLKVLSPSEG